MMGMGLYAFGDGAASASKLKINNEDNVGIGFSDNSVYYPNLINHQTEIFKKKANKRNYNSKKEVSLTKEYNRPAVYLLFDVGEIVYVGQSMKPLQRIGQHQKSKIFDSYRIMYCAENRRLYWETKLIHAFKPMLNRTFK